MINLSLKPSLNKALLASMAALFASFSANASIVPSPPAVAAKGYVLMDYHTGELLAASNENTRLSPASLTKMMTSYVIGQEVKAGNVSLDDDVTISKNAWARNFPGSSKMFLEVGKTVKLEELNKGIIIQSGNDACVAVAEHIAGSEGAFVDLMNGWAQHLGMTNSHYGNVHGLDNPELYSTPYDLALLGQALIRDVPEEYRVYSNKSFTYNGITQHNRNGLLWDKNMNVDGIKTGYTSNAGYNLVSSATQGEMRLIAVVMGTKNPDARKSESKKLLSYGFRFFETVAPNTAGEVFATEKVWMADKPTINLGVDEDTFVTLPRGSADQLTANFVLDQELQAPIEKGQKVGTLYYDLEGENIAQYSLVALESVQEGSLFSRMWDYIVMLVNSWF
ncbi:serine hydrolase [Vibrio agarivorans]|uniref:serine-type D-Ala-D-Ala carboxypeptidase n=1 Tax=Vibrio agarivorans TaxID=153622 RepID=A0ABT7Y193_9VIBR|nr:serine hydrolase [Vibrio agarivorans]MDN2481785.1 serine hydrolase [Vibrio agarivorans]